MKISTIHPFPARMAPEIAIAQLQSLSKGSVVLDPMMGSGTVIRHAIQIGHKAKGFDMDPLAVLMSRVWSTAIDDEALNSGVAQLEDLLADLEGSSFDLPWIDECSKTSAFISFWFGESQRRDLRRVAFALKNLEESGKDVHSDITNLFKVALSRIIITKGDGASLAHDVSHSRPHKVMTASTYDVVQGFLKSVRQVQGRMKIKPHGTARVSLGDARKPNRVRDGSVDMVLTSPPYLNAIDYMRGHKLSLVWLGHSLPELTTIRSTSIGAERGIDEEPTGTATRIQRAMVDGANLNARDAAMIKRYSRDLEKSLAQTVRVLKKGGKAIYVVGNSCLRGTFIRNSEGVIKAAKAAGLTFLHEETRALPSGSRYLPMPKSLGSALGKRMRTESVLAFERAA
jgi:DNA modification methylase